MKHAELGKNYKVFLSDDEMSRLKKFLEARGAKMATYTRQLIIREIESFEAIQSNKTQIDMSSFQGGQV